MTKEGYFDWEKKLKKEEKEEWKELLAFMKKFRKKWKKPIFIVNRDLRKKK
jgi:hypothetical protein